MRWLELTARVDAEAVEAVGEAFSGVAHGGIAIEPDLVPGCDDGVTLGLRATVRAYIPADDAAPAKTRSLEEALWHLRAIWPVGELGVREVADADWASAWKEHYPTFRVGRRIVVRPTWLADQPGPDDVLIALDPGPAFGTGLHPTTRRCLELLEEVVRPGDRVLDVGTGSGILALAAAGLGAGEVVAVDVDPTAVDTARANVAANGRAELIRVMVGSVDQAPAGATYDVVVANIIARVLVELTPQLAARLAAGGTVIAAGIIADRASEVVDAFARVGLRARSYVDGDWISLRCQATGGDRPCSGSSFHPIA